MTYEEAKRIIIRHRLLFASMPDEVLEALDLFMKHDQVSDSIRKEIEQKLGTHGNISLYNKAINDVLMIIDKYREVEE